MKRNILYGERALTHVNTEYGYTDGRDVKRIVLVVSKNERLAELTELLEQCENRIKARKTTLRDAHANLQIAVDTGDNELIDTAMSFYRHCETLVKNAELDRVTLTKQIVTLNNGQYIIY